MVEIVRTVQSSLRVSLVMLSCCGCRVRPGVGSGWHATFGILHKRALTGKDPMGAVIRQM